MAAKSNTEIPVAVGHYLKWLYVTERDIREVKETAEFGKFARTRRKFLGLSQQRVAAAIQDNFDIPWHQTVVAKIESGERQIKLHEALALSRLYAISLEELMTGWNLQSVDLLHDKELANLDSLKAEVEAAQERWKDRHGVDSEAE